jgi:hypothetical protein
MVQWMIPIHLIGEKEILSTIEKTSFNSRQSMTFLAENKIQHHIECFNAIKNIFIKIMNLNLDSTEFDYLKTISLLKNGNKNLYIYCIY